jgi:hypothetical protein
MGYKETIMTGRQPGPRQHARANRKGTHAKSTMTRPRDTLITSVQDPSATVAGVLLVSGIIIRGVVRPLR